MGLAILLKVLLSLVVVISIMYIALKVLQKYTKIGIRNKLANSGVTIEGVIYIDENNKIVNLRKSQTGYLLAMNKNNIVLIDKYDVIE